MSDEKNTRVKDSSSKTIFEDPILCAQFLRGYVDIPMLKDVQPEDIEDVTTRYTRMFSEERNSDVVKRVHMRTEGKSEADMPFFLVSLVEHKSRVDYNVIMQLFRYIALIWEDYEKAMERERKGISRTKGFKYPPILPIVFYDGEDNWTAAVSLHERVALGEALGKYTPDYQYFLVQLKDYSNRELMAKRDELSVIMMIDRLQGAKDFAELSSEIGPAYLDDVIKDASGQLLDIIAQVTEGLLLRLNVPEVEVDEFTKKIKERRVGELLANFKGWDVQAIRRQSKEEAKIEVREEVKEEVKEEVREEVREEVKEEAREEGIKKIVKVVQKYNGTKEDVIRDLVEQYSLDEKQATEKVKLYW